MNIVVLNRSDWLDQRKVRLVDRRADHIRSVLRAAVGDSIRVGELNGDLGQGRICACLLYTSPSPRDKRQSRMPSSA